MAQNTKQALAESLIRLLHKKTLDKITIRDITDGCGFNRQTFYYHFEDIYALVEYIFMDNNPLRIIQEDTAALSWMDACRQLHQTLLNDKTLILNLYHSIEGRTLRMYMFKSLHPAILTLVRREAADIPVREEDILFLAHSYTHCTIGLLIDWLDNNMRADYSAHMEKFLYLLDGSMKLALQKLTSMDPA